MKRFVLILFPLLWALIPLQRFDDFLFGDMLIGHRDNIFFDLLVRSYFFENIKSGFLSFFYPFPLQGISAIALPVNGTMHPLTVATSLVFSPVAAWKALVWFCYFLIPCGWFLALRAWRIPALPAMVAATLFVQSGLMWSAVYRPAELPATLWSGFTVFVYLSALQRRSILYMMLSGILAGFSYLGGDPLTPVITLAIGFFLGLDEKDALKFSLATIPVVGLSYLATILPHAIHGSEVYKISARSFGYTIREGLSYSSHWNRLLEIVFPWSLPSVTEREYPWRHLQFGYSSQWWYDSIGFGVAATAALAAGIRISLRESKRWLIYIAVILALICLSWGVHLWQGEKIWGMTWPLSRLRSPERLLRYAFIGFIPLTAVGLRWLFSYFGKTERNALAAMLLVAAVSLMETSVNLPEKMQVPVETLNVPGSLSALKAASDAEPGSVRIIKCPAPVGGLTPESDIYGFDPRVWNIPIVAGDDGVETPMNKLVNCSWALEGPFLKLFGISHFVQPRTTEKVDPDFIAGFETNLVVTDPLFDLYEVKSSAPRYAWFNPDYSRQAFVSELVTTMQYGPSVDVATGLARFKSGGLTVDPEISISESGWLRTNSAQVPDPQPCESGEEQVALRINRFQDQISFEAEFPCRGMVLVPYNFFPGWRAKINGADVPIFRIGDNSLGLAVEPGRSQASLSYDPPFVVHAAGASTAFVLSVLVLAFMRRRGEAQRS